MTTLERAISIACKAHENQKDKAGEPYILHPLRVMLNMKEEHQKIVAVLHDVIEDTSIEFSDLKKEGFSDIVLESLQCLTRNKDENYNHYIDKIKENKTALQVKLSDLSDNMNISRLKKVSDHDMERLKKYHRAWHELSQY